MSRSGRNIAGGPNGSTRARPGVFFRGFAGAMTASGSRSVSRQSPLSPHCDRGRLDRSKTPGYDACIAYGSSP